MFAGISALSVVLVHGFVPETRGKTLEEIELLLGDGEALFTSRVFEGMRGDYFVSRNFPDRLFTSPGFERIIPRYPHKSPPL
jgi:hypothetical protein